MSKLLNNFHEVKFSFVKFNIFMNTYIGILEFSRYLLFSLQIEIFK